MTKIPLQVFPAGATIDCRANRSFQNHVESVAVGSSRSVTLTAGVKDEAANAYISNFLGGPNHKTSCSQQMIWVHGYNTQSAV